MYHNLYAIGLPLKEDSASAEFISFFETPAVCICIINNCELKNTLDYSCCPYGYDYLLNQGYEFVSLDDYDGSLKKIIILPESVWVKDNKRVNIFEAAKTVLTFLEQIVSDTKRYALVFSGSLYYYNNLFNVLEQNFVPENLIDTKSSGDYCYDELRHYNKPLNLCLYINKGAAGNAIKPHHVNLVSCLGKVYSVFINYDRFVSDINENMEYYAMKIGQQNSIVPMTYEQVVDSLRNNKSYWNDKTLAVIT